MNFNVLYVHPMFDRKDFIVPFGLLGLMNSIKYTKHGVFSCELNAALLSKVKIVVMDLHWFMNMRKVGEVSKYIKKNNASIKIILGGATAMCFPKHIFKNTKVDYIIIGDAEYPFRRVIREILENDSKEINRIPNVVSRKFRTKQSYFIKKYTFNNLDCITHDWFPAYKDVIKVQGPFIPINRGCPHLCSWCCGNKYYQSHVFKRAPVIRDVKYVVRDIEYVINNNISNVVNVIGDVFELKEKKLISHKYIKRLFSKSYDIGLYYEFFNLPMINDIKLLERSFSNLVLCISMNKDHGQSLKLNNLREIIRIIKYVQRLDNAKLIIYCDVLDPVLRNMIRQVKMGVSCDKCEFVSDSNWRMVVPRLYSDGDAEIQYEYFKDFNWNIKPPVIHGKRGGNILEEMVQYEYFKG